MTDKVSEHFRNKVKPLFTNNANKNPYTQSGHIYSLVWNSTGDSIAFNSSDKSIIVAKVSQNKIITSKVLTGHSDEVTQVQFSPVNDHIIVSASYDKTVRLWDIKGAAVIAKAKIDCSHFDWCADGKEVAVVGRDSVIYFLDGKSLKVIKKLHLKMDIKGVKWSSALLYLITGEGSIVILSHSLQKVVHTLNAHTAACQCVEFDRTGRFFAVGSSDATASVWDARDHICLYSLLRLDWPVRSVGFSFDGNLLAASSEEDSNIDVSLTSNGTRLFSIASTHCQILQWSPCSYMLSCVCEDVERNTSTIKLYGGVD